MVLHSALGLYWQKVRALFFEANVTFASFVQREVAFSQENDGGIVFTFVFPLSSVSVSS